MWAILTNAVNYLLRLLFTVAPIKFVFLIVVFLIIDVLLKIVFSFLPSWLNPQLLINSIPPDFWWFLHLMSLDTGFPMLMAAWAIRFLIRRVPFVG